MSVSRIVLLSIPVLGLSHSLLLLCGVGAMSAEAQTPPRPANDVHWNSPPASPIPGVEHNVLHSPSMEPQDPSILLGLTHFQLRTSGMSVYRVESEYPLIGRHVAVSRSIRTEFLGQETESMESSEEQNQESNRWFKKRIVPVIDDECQVALRFLQRHTKGNPVGNPESFAHSTMQVCEFAVLEIARALTDDPTVALERRVSGMTTLVSHTLVYPSTTLSVDRVALKRLLQEQPADSLSQLEMARLCRALALSPELWPETNEYLEIALGKIARDLKVRSPRSLNRPEIVIETVARCMRALRIILSQPPIEQ